MSRVIYETGQDRLATRPYLSDTAKDAQSMYISRYFYIACYM